MPSLDVYRGYTHTRAICVRKRKIRPEKTFSTPAKMKGRVQRSGQGRVGPEHREALRRKVSEAPLRL